MAVRRADISAARLLIKAGANINAVKWVDDNLHFVIYLVSGQNGNVFFLFASVETRLYNARCTAELIQSGWTFFSLPVPIYTLKTRYAGLI